jgi:hypothetical protein
MITMDGPVTLQVPDVFAMMQLRFWNTDVITAARYCALVAFLACCQILPGFARSIRISDWRPDGRDVVRLWRFGQWQTVPLTPQAILVIERFITERNRVLKELGKDSEYLFIRSTGKPFGPDIDNGFERLRKRIRAKLPIARMLRNFCVRHLRTGGDEAASRRFRGISKPLARGTDYRLPKIPEDRIARLVRRTNPFRAMDRQFNDERAASRWLADQTLVVPVEMTGKKKTMPGKHPLVAKLLKIVWPRSKADCNVTRARLWEEYGEEIDQELRVGALSQWHVARLLHTTEKKVHNFVWLHYRSGRAVPIKYRQPRSPTPVKPQASEAEERAISAVRQPLPIDPAEASEETERRLIRYYPTIDPMIARGIMTAKEVSNLFGVRARQIDFLHNAAKVGLTAEQMLRRAHGPVSEEWWEKVRQANTTRRFPDSDLAFFCRMVAAGFPGSLKAFKRFCQMKPRPTPAMTNEEQSIVDALSAMQWSSERKFLREQREDVLRAYLVGVDRLIVAGKIGTVRAGRLMNLGDNILAYYRQAIAAGLSVEQALERPRRASVDMWKLVRKEHDAAPEEPDLPFLFRMKLVLGFPGGINAIRTFRAGLRSTAGPLYFDEAGLAAE